MLKNDPEIVRGEDGRVTSIKLDFDGPEAVGLVEIHMTGYGPVVAVNGVDLALIDLYHLSPTAGVALPEKRVQIILFTRDDEPLITAGYFPNRVVVDEGEDGRTLLSKFDVGEEAA